MVRDTCSKQSCAHCSHRAVLHAPACMLSSDSRATCVCLPGCRAYVLQLTVATVLTKSWKVTFEETQHVLAFAQVSDLLPKSVGRPRSLVSARPLCATQEARLRLVVA